MDDEAYDAAIAAKIERVLEAIEPWLKSLLLHHNTEEYMNAARKETAMALVAIVKEIDFDG